MAYIGHEFFYDGTRATFFGHLCTGLINMGWELHDDIDADTKVYKSNGESGNEPYGYIYIDAGTSTYIQFIAYQYWNNSTHVGTRLRYTNDNIATPRLTLFSATVPAIISGDKDFVFAGGYARYNGGTMISFGHCKRINTVVGAHGTAGTAGTLTVATTAGLGVRKRFQIVSEDGYCDILYISSIPNSSTIIVNDLARNYGTGSKIGQPASTFGLTNGISSPKDSWYPVSVWGDSGTAGTSTMKYELKQLESPNISSVLFFNEAKYMLVPIFVNSVSALVPGCVVGHLGSFLYGVMTADNDVMVANNDGSFSSAGTASSSGSNSLIDSTKSWDTDALVGQFCVLSGTAGTAAGWVKKITGNDATSLTVDSNWIGTCGTSINYQVVDIVRRGLSTQITAYVYVLITSTIAPA